MQQVISLPAARLLSRQPLCGSLLLLLLLMCGASPHGMRQQSGTRGAICAGLRPCSLSTVPRVRLPSLLAHMLTKRPALLLLLRLLPVEAVHALGGPWCEVWGIVGGHAVGSASTAAWPGRAPIAHGLLVIQPR